MADEIARQAPGVSYQRGAQLHDTRFCDRMTLASVVLTYHSFYSTDTGLLSPRRDAARL